MRCPFCAADDDKVVDSRPADDGTAVRRRRECLGCGHRYTTSQDASEFKDQLPSETATLIGPTAMKYSSKNPANSILICEEWSGLRPAAPQVHIIQAKESSHT